MGVNVSNPFAAAQGKPSFFTLSWRFRAVMSTAKAWNRGFRRKSKQGRGREIGRQLVWLVLTSLPMFGEDILYPAIWDSALACDMSLPPFPITRPSSTVINKWERGMSTRSMSKGSREVHRLNSLGVETARFMRESVNDIYKPSWCAIIPCGISSLPPDGR